MGQRSQIYIRYNNGETLVAKHLQWNYGGYMVSRAKQLLEYIHKNIMSCYSNFKSKDFDISNWGNYREDLKILDSLISLNLDIGSYVQNTDLIKEQLEYSRANASKEKFKINPELQDNNNGILVIDILEDDEENTYMKYGFARGSENYKEEENFEGFKMCSCVDYIVDYMPDNDYLKDYYNEEELKELNDKFTQSLKIASIIDEKYTLLTDKEFHSIFKKKYLYSKCLSEKDYKEALQEKERYEEKRKQYIKKCLYYKVFKAIENKESSIISPECITDEEINYLEEKGFFVEKCGMYGNIYYSCLDKAIMNVNGETIEDIITNENEISRILNINTQEDER